MNFYSSIIFLYVMSFLHLTLSTPCITDNYQYTFTKCSNKTRNIFFSYKTTCEPDQTTSNLPLSIIGTQCKQCNSGEYLIYNFETNSQECQKCPVNTYSTGGSFKIRGNNYEWNNHQLFSSLTNECLIINKETENSNCKGFTIEQDGKYIKTNNGYDINEYDYIAYLSMQVEIVSPGKIEFTYKKDSIIEDSIRNGIFQFYVNYLIEIDDSNTKLNNVWNKVTIPLEPGKYSFLWQYYKIVNSDNSKKLSLYISDIIIDGTESASLTCMKCHNGVSNIGSDHCNYCDKTKYFDKITSTCIDCPKGKISKPFLSGIESCITIPPCTKDHYYRINSKKCNAYTNKQNVQYELIEDNCIENGTSGVIRETSMECNKCLPGQYIKKVDDIYTKCEYCPGGSYSNVENSNSCATCEGWIGNVMYITPDIPKQYKGEIEIAETIGELIITYNLINKTIEEPGIGVELDGKYIAIGIKNKKINIQLSKGKHNIYIKSDNAILEMLTITNTVHGGGQICKACSDGFMVQEGDNLVCKNCGSGMQLNSNNECEQCPDSYYKTSNDHYEKCKECPILTKPNDKRTHCIPQNVITNYPLKQKFILSNYEKYQNDLCKFTNNLCSNSFYGPIKESTNIMLKNQTQPYLYFISILQPALFSNNDFTYKYKTNINESYIYVLENDKDSNDKTKILTSLGKEIDYIKMILTHNKKGVVIKYINGDKCNENPSQNYETIIFLNCTKEQNELMNFHSPKFIFKKQCTFYFEWSSKMGCPLCKLSQVEMFKLSCRNFKRDIYYSESDSCIIDSTKNLDTNILKEEQIVDVFEHVLINDVDNISSVYNINLNDIDKTPQLNDSDYYIEYKKISEVCYLYDDFDKEILIIVISIPIIYLLILILCIYFWCKYKRLNNDYQRLIEEPNVQ